MTRKGFIKMDRDILDWSWYQDGNTFRVYFHLILTVNYTDTKWRDIDLKRGQRIISYATLAGELNMSVQNVRTALDHLCLTGEVTKSSQGKYTVISVNNYDRFQMGNKVSNILATSSSQDTNNGIKNIKNIKKDIEEDDEERTASSLSVSVSDVVSLYSEICKSLPTPEILPDTEAHIRRAINFYGMDKIRQVFESVENTPFLRGEVKNWCADINWIFADKNIQNILNGKYREYKPKKKDDELDVEKYKRFINAF